MLLVRHTVMPHAIRIHGIAWTQPRLQTTCTPLYRQILVVVHGDRHVSMIRLCTSGGVCSVTPVLSLPRLLAWTMDVHLSWNACTASGRLAVGLSDNALELYALSLNEEGGVAAGLVQRTDSSERCLLYSMHMLACGGSSPSHEAEALHAVPSRYLVAGGTVYLDVVIWAAPSHIGEEGSGGAAVAPLLYKLKGHEGAIHRVRWLEPPWYSSNMSSSSSLLLASASDDRTLRIGTFPLLWQSTKPSS